MGDFKYRSGDNINSKSASDLFLCLSLGLVGGLAIGYVTELMTSYTYKPVQ